MKKEYSNELERVIKYIKDILFNEYPSDKITMEYLLLAILEEKKSNAYNIIMNNVLMDKIETTQVFLSRFLSTQQNKKGEKDEIIFDDNLGKIMEELNNLDKVTIIKTDDILLQILKSNTKLKRTLLRLGVSENHFKKHIFLNEIAELAELAELSTNKKKKNNIEDKTKPFKSYNISKYTINLHEAYGMGELNHLIGRDKEIKKIFQILNKQSINKVLLVGESGVGKSIMINGIIDAIETFSSPNKFIEKNVVKLDLNKITSGITFNDILDERMQNINNYFEKSKKHILFIDDIHLQTNTVKSAIINNFVGNDNLPIIMTCDLKKYKDLVDNNPLISKNFEKVILEPTTINETVDILTEVKHTYEDFHNIKLNENIINIAVKLSSRYLTDKNLPFSALSFIDMVGADINSSNINNKELIPLYTQLNANIIKSKEANKEKNYDLVDELSIDEKKIRKEINSLINNKKKAYEINEEDLYRVITTLTDIPITKLDGSLSSLKNISDVLKQHVIGQDEAIDKVTAGIKRKQVGLGGKNKPISFMCIGESGTGKTLLAKTIAKELLGGEQNLIRYDMSEFSEKHSISKLIGSPPGYVSHETGGGLTEAVKHKKYSVLLLDEIEKACPEVFNLFLQLLDDGFLTDSSGVKFDFSNVIIMMTSNVGAKKASEFSVNVGFNANKTNSNEIINKEFKKLFPPEFINRITDVLIFNKLGEEQLKNIIKLKLNDLNSNLNENGYTIKWTNNVINYIYDNIDKENGYGARPINRYIETEIESKIIDKIIDEELKNYTFNLNIKNKELTIK